MDLALLLSDLTVQLPAGMRLQRLAAAVRADFQCDAVVILALEPGAAPCLRPVVAVGLTRDAMGRRFLLSEQPRLAAIVASREVVAFEADSRLPDPYDGLVEGHPGQPLPVHDCMGMRLLQEGRTWGVLTLDGLRPGRFSPTDRERLNRLLPLVEAAVRVSRLERENQDLRQARAWAARAREDEPALAGTGGDDLEIVAHSEVMHRLLEETQVVARSELPVLLLGETGVGKELFARRLHRLSARSDQPLVLVNCAALPETLAESELFGHVKGAFSGATSDRPGRVEAAQGGTLFLDEVGDIPLPMQVKLLRLLESGTYRRVGSTELRHADVRLVSATHRDLAAMVAQGRFREDLYYRLSTFPIALPPLRERLGDLPLLAHALLERLTPGRPLSLDAGAVQQLARHPFPGNVRELRNVLERAVLLTDGDHITAETVDRALSVGLLRRPSPLAGAATAAAEAPSPAPTGASLRQTEAQALRAALQAHHGSREALAAALGISVRTLYRKLRALDEDGEDGPTPG